MLAARLAFLVSANSCVHKRTKEGQAKACMHVQARRVPAVFKATSLPSSTTHPPPRAHHQHTHNPLHTPTKQQDKPITRREGTKPRPKCCLYAMSHTTCPARSHRPQASEPSDSSVSHTQAKLPLLQPGEARHDACGPGLISPSPGQNKPRTLRYTQARPWAVNARGAMSLIGW